MPKGSPNTQTRATDRYQKRAGLVAKSYKIRKELADDFARACERAGRSQASVISELMQEFIKNNS